MSVYLYFAIRYNIYVEVATKRLYSLFPCKGKSKHNNKRTHIRVRLCCIWAKCGVGQFIDGHRVVAQPYLINE